MRKAVWLAVLLLLVALSLQTHSITDLPSLTPDQLDEDGLIEVTESSQTRSVDSLQREYYVLRVVHKQKKQAYFSMKGMFERVVRLLLRAGVIPDAASLVQSKIKPQYLSKKRSWQFSTIFALLGSGVELERCRADLSRLGIQRLSTKPSINFLNEKIMALEVFNSARSRLVRGLAVTGEFEIKEVAEIEIKGGEVKNSDLLEEQLEEEFNDSGEVIEEGEIMVTENENVGGQIEMKVIFRVGRPAEEGESEGQPLEEITRDEESYSDHSEESL